MKPRALVLCGYGINSDAELAEAFALAGAEADRVHASDLLAEPERLAGYRILAFPGGFSFGDHLGSGMVLANLLRERLLGPIRDLIARGGLAIGICNGFQVLVKLGLLPGLDGPAEASLVHNEREGYLDTWVHVAFEPGSKCVWTAGLEPRMLPIRHGEGRFVTRDQETLQRIEAEGLVAVRYSRGNPNGSAGNVAGLCDPSGRVFGLMPHPEAFLWREQHPLRRRAESAGPTGLELFSRGVAAAAR
jgi:phosphoribosylformylglycinamidine synthase